MSSHNSQPSPNPSVLLPKELLLRYALISLIVTGIFFFQFKMDVPNHGSGDGIGLGVFILNLIHHAAIAALALLALTWIGIPKGKRLVFILLSPLLTAFSLTLLPIIDAIQEPAPSTDWQRSDKAFNAFGAHFPAGSLVRTSGYWFWKKASDGSSEHPIQWGSLSILKLEQTLYPGLDKKNLEAILAKPQAIAGWTCSTNATFELPLKQRDNAPYYWPFTGCNLDLPALQTMLGGHWSLPTELSRNDGDDEPWTLSQREPEIRCQKPQIVDGFKLNYIQSARLNGQRRMVFLLAQTCGDMTIGRYRFPDDSYLQKREINEYWLSGSGKNLATGESISCVKLKSTAEVLSPC